MIIDRRSTKLRLWCGDLCVATGRRAGATPIGGMSDGYDEVVDYQRKLEADSSVEEEDDDDPEEYDDDPRQAADSPVTRIF